MVSFTPQQQAEIKALIEAGDEPAAQRLILAALTAARDQPRRTVHPLHRLWTWAARLACPRHAVTAGPLRHPAGHHSYHPH